ncbi:MAG: UDP-N-acetylmuramoyl-tripeptide--D-alanyl-D-alanine ligase [Thermoleophilia bacterium]|nr:UDP-N-acetylmuramoyl-tripeptide--D-alanyl-D-alanine ligase [Thermoleophilia bacterium]
MIPLAVEEVRRLAPGRLEARAGEVTGVAVDSRRVVPGDLFVAVGRGREYVDEALERGAAAALVPDDAFAALAALAGEVRSRSRAKVAAITGSVGKTSTKDILAALCRPHARTVAAEAGFNNEVGLPLTLLAIESETEVVVAEMGMRGLGQIAALCGPARPDVGVITAVGPVHLELLGTVERVAEAKAELVAALPPGGTAVVPADEPLLEPFLRRGDVELVRFGAGADVRPLSFEPPQLVADVLGTVVELKVPFAAEHHARNALAALGAYAALGLPLDGAAEGAPTISFSRLRGEETELPGGGVLINDSWNANPVSMRAALEYLVRRAGGRRTVAVLGRMAELGDGSEGFHAAVGAAAAEVGVGVVVAVGGGDADRYGGLPAASPEDAAALLRELLEPGDVVLVKGSRVARLEAVAEALAGVPT